MKALVAIKRVVDYNVKIRIRADKSGVDTENVKMSMNPFCEIALEEAIALKEQGKLSEVVAVSIGNNVQDILRQALAMGACHAIEVTTETDHHPLAIAKALRELVLREDYNMVFLGKQSIDGDNNQTGQMLAALLNWPQATFASSISWGGDNMCEVVREVDGGLETIQVQLPAVITADLRLNTPRYPSLPNIMKAKRKPIESLTYESLGIHHISTQQCISVSPPPERSAGVIVKSVEELLDKLKNEAKVL